MAAAIEGRSIKGLSGRWRACRTDPWEQFDVRGAVLVLDTVDLRKPAVTVSETIGPW